jgi:hypothetical protein
MRDCGRAHAAIVSRLGFPAASGLLITLLMTLLRGGTSVVEAPLRLFVGGEVCGDVSIASTSRARKVTATVPVGKRPRGIKKLTRGHQERIRGAQPRMRRAGQASTNPSAAHADVRRTALAS